ncbi:MAG: site-specific integrase [Desulfuromonas sp.]
MSVQADKARQPPKLLDQMRESMRARHYRPRTEETYCQWVRRYIFFHQKRHPADMGERDDGYYSTDQDCA